MFVYCSRNFPQFSDDDDMDSDLAIDDLDSKMDSLRPMFPARSDMEIKQALLDANGDAERAIDLLIGLGIVNKVTPHSILILTVG